MRAWAITVGAAMALGAATAAGADTQRYLGLVGPSAHLGDGGFHDATFGLSLGWRRDLAPRWVGEVEGGVFYNSYEEVSPFVLGGVAYEAARIGAGDLYLGVAAGLARYSEIADDLRADGIPTLGDLVPVGYLTARYQTGGVGTRLTVVPPLGDGPAAVNLSFAIDF